MLNPSRYFRISVTSKCNLSCPFCHKEGNYTNLKGELTPEEIQFACKTAYEFGFNKFKITGGEPTEREDLSKIISLLVELGLPDLSIITNGTNLKSQAQSLWDAGLRRMNVTLNTLNPKRFRYFAFNNHISVSSIIEGIETAQQTGFNDIKVNFVFFDEYSIADLNLLIKFVRDKGLTLVVLPVIGSENYYSLDDVYNIIKVHGISSEKIISDSEGLLKREIRLDSGATILLRLDELASKKPYVFCNQCENSNQCREGIFPIRLSSNGELIPCMADIVHRIDVRGILHNQDIKGMKEAFSKIRMWEINNKMNKI